MKLKYQPIPLSKIEDFGVHCKQYYLFEVSFFNLLLDEYLLEYLWNRYGINTLRLAYRLYVYVSFHFSTSTLLTKTDYTTDQINNVADELEQGESHLDLTSFLSLPEETTKQDDKLAKTAQD